MPLVTRKSVLAELEDAISSGSTEKRVDTLRRITDLFLCDADRFSEVQIKLFDDVLCHLIKRIEIKVLAELSTRLAPIENSPPELIRELARDDNILVAGPVLTQSVRLSAEDLIEIIQTRSQAHLLAISGRCELVEAVTDQLLDRGDCEVVHKLAKNAGAQFSESGFATLVNRAETDETLAKKLGLRLDLPLRLLRELLTRATEAVRSWLLANAPVESKKEIQRVMAAVSNEVAREATAPRDFTPALALMRRLKERGELDESTLLEFAKHARYEEMVVALAELSSASVQTIAAVMRSDFNDGLLIPCRAVGLRWSTVSTILQNRFAHHSISDDELAQAKSDYLVLSRASAQRTLRFWQVRDGIGVDDRRSGMDRRSGFDTRTVEERLLLGERRSNGNRRSGQDRRMTND
jgi:uncharacterized protein (DUF2336 family)